MTVPSRAAIAGITGADSFAVGGGEAGYIAVRADDPNVIFAGNYQGILTRYDRRTGQARNVMVWPESSAGEGAGALKYRMQWTAPTVHSPHDPNVLYHTGNHVFRTTDEGTTWERLSPDLTRNDKSKLGPSGGPITKDNTGAEYYCTVFAFAESPVERGVLWAGSDDGLLHVSEMSRRRVTDPKEVVQIGQEVRVKVIKVDNDGDAAERERGLRDVVARVCLDAFGKLDAQVLRRMRTDQHAVAT